jgi:hypothetical protein
MSICIDLNIPLAEVSMMIQFQTVEENVPRVANDRSMRFLLDVQNPKSIATCVLRGLHCTCYTANFEFTGSKSSKCSIALAFS